MAAGPETQHGNLNIGYNYQPVETKLNPPIQLPGTGELWAKVGDTALRAAGQLQSSAQMLQQSPVNPAIRSQMYEAQERANMGRDYIDFVRQNPNWMHAVTGEGQGGATTVAPITQPVTQQNQWDLDYDGSGGGGGKGKGSGDGSQEKKEEQPKKKAPEPPANLNEGLAQAAPAPDSISAALASTRVPSQGGSTAALSAGGDGMLNTGQPQSSDIVAQPAPQPSGSIFNPMRPAPLAPPAPVTPPPAAQPAAGGSPAAATKADQVAMQKWQNQSMGQPMTSQDALSWAKSQSTLNQDATYLPMGGPGGSPAFAFHVKGGGMNIVPVSQMVQKGAGPLVASQNTSQVISQTDQAQQADQSQQPTGQVTGAPTGTPDQPWGAPTQMQPTGQVAGAPTGTPAQPWGPPAAPTGQPQIAQAQPQYPNISGPPPAPVPGAYDPTLYRQGIAQAMAQPGNLMAQERPQAGVRSTEPQPVTSRPATAEEAKNLPSAQTMEADAAKPDHRTYNWQTGTDANGNSVTYADLPDPGGRPFITQRYYKGTLSGFQIGPQDTTNLIKQQLWDELMGPKGTPLPENTHITEADIRDSTPEWREHWMRYIRDMDNHRTAPTATSDEGQNLANASNAVQAAQRIKDKIQYLKDNNLPMDTISEAELIRSKEAGWAGASANNPLQWGLWAMLAHGPKSNFADQLGSDYKLLNSYLSKVKGGTYPDAATPPDQELGGKVTWPVDIGDRSIPQTTDVSTIAALNKIGSGDTHEEALGHIQEVLNNATKDYINASKQVRAGNMRLPDADQKNISDLLDPRKGYIEDKTNKMWDEKHQKLDNGYGKIPDSPSKWLDNWVKGQANPSPSPTPVSREVADAAPRPQTQAEYDKIKSGDLYWDRDGKLKPKP